MSKNETDLWGLQSLELAIKTFSREAGLAIGAIEPVVKVLRYQAGGTDKSGFPHGRVNSALSSAREAINSLVAAKDSAETALMILDRNELPTCD